MLIVKEIYDIFDNRRSTLLLTSLNGTAIKVLDTNTNELFTLKELSDNVFGILKFDNIYSVNVISDSFLNVLDYIDYINEGYKRDNIESLRILSCTDLEFDDSLVSSVVIPTVHEDGTNIVYMQTNFKAVGVQNTFLRLNDLEFISIYDFIKKVLIAYPDMLEYDSIIIECSLSGDNYKHYFVEVKFSNISMINRIITKERVLDKRN